MNRPCPISCRVRRAPLEHLAAVAVGLAAALPLLAALTAASNGSAAAVTAGFTVTPDVGAGAARRRQPDRAVLTERRQPRRAALGGRGRPLRQGLRLPPLRRARCRGVALQRRRARRLVAFGRADQRERARHRLRRQRQRGSPRAQAGTRPSRPEAATSGSFRPSTPRPTGLRDSAVAAGLTVGDYAGGYGVEAGSLGQNTYALAATNGAVLGGFPWFSADSVFSTAAVADLYADGNTEIISGGDSSGGLRLRPDVRATAGHIRILVEQRAPPAPDPRPAGSSASTTRTRTSTAPRRRSGNSLPGGGGGHRHRRRQLLPGRHRTPTRCSPSHRLRPRLERRPQRDHGRLARRWPTCRATGSSTSWRAPRPGPSTSSTAPTAASSGRRPTTGEVIGSPVTADLSGRGYQDVIVPTTNGIDVFDGQSGHHGDDARAPAYAFQNSPLVTDDPDGHIGITGAGYAGSGGHRGRDRHPLGDRQHRRVGVLGERAGRLAAVPPRPAADRGRRHAAAASARGAVQRARRRSRRLHPLGVRRRRLRLRQHPVLRLDRQHPPQPAGGGHGAHPRRRRLLGGRRPTAASSPSATPASTGRMGGTPLNAPHRRHGGHPRRTAGTGRSPSDGGIFTFGDAQLLRQRPAPST